MLSSIHHRDQARLYAKQVHDGQGELELSPEEDEAIRLALAGGDGLGSSPAARLDPRWRPRDAGRLLRPRGDLHPGGAARRASRRGVDARAVPLPTIYDTVMAVHDGAVDARARADRELAGGRRSTPRSTRWRMETDDVVIVGEVVQPIRHCLIARTALALDGDRDRRLPPPGQRPVRALHPHAAAGARVLAGSSTAEAVRTVAEHDGPWAALGNRLAAERYGCLVLRAGVEDVAGNETRFVWLAPARARRPAARRGARGPPLAVRRPRSCSGARAPRRPGWLVALPVGVRRARRQPDPDRVAAAQAGARPATCSSWTWRARATMPRSPPAWPGCAATCERLRVLGSFPPLR